MENHQSIPTNNAIISARNLSSRHINEQLISTPVPSNKFSNGDITQQEIDAYINSFPPGFRFLPTDVELVKHYLWNRLHNLNLPPNRIYEMNIYQYNPDAIAANFRPSTEEKMWYILTPRDRKYKKGNRPNRAAGDGYWKATGADKKIKDKGGDLIGLKKALVFYIGKSPKGEKTDWIMHEYRAPDVQYSMARNVDDWRLDDWVLCSIYKKSERDNTMFHQRKRTRDEYNVSVEEGDGQVRESSNENRSSELANTFEGCEDSIRHESTNGNMSIQDSIDKLHSNNPTSIHPQVPSRLGNKFPTFGNVQWPSACIDNYQSCLPAVTGTPQTCSSNFNHHEDILTNYNLHPPSPMKIEPISSIIGASSLVGQYQMEEEEFGQPCFSSCIGGWRGLENHEFVGLGNDELAYDYVDRYLVNAESSTSNNSITPPPKPVNSDKQDCEKVHC